MAHGRHAWGPGRGGIKKLRIAVGKLAYGETEEAPVELVEVWLCEKFHCTPSQLDQEDGNRLLLMMELDSVHRAMAKMATEGPKGLSAAEQKIVGNVLREEAESGRKS